MISLLIIDDDLEIREGIKQGIDWNSNGINVCGTASSANEALDMIESKAPDIVILDVKMPKMDGLELLEVMNVKFPNIKVILISGYDDFSYAQQAVSLNAFCYLLKPLDPETLLSKVLEARDHIYKIMEQLQKNEEINRKLKENIPVLRDNFFSQLVTGKLADTTIIADKATFLGIDLHSSSYAVLVLDIEGIETDKDVSLHHKNLLKFAVINCAENLLKNNYRYYSFNLEENIVFLICSNGLARQTLNSICKSIRSEVNNSLGLSLTIGVGGIYFSSADITVSYKQALEALKYKLILGRNEIIEYQPSDNSSSGISSEISLNNFLKQNKEPLLNALRTSNTEEIAHLTEEIAKVIQQAVAVNINAKNGLMFLLTSFLTELLMSVNMDTEQMFTGDDDLFNKFKRLQTINEVRDLISAFLGDIKKELECREKAHNNSILNKALEYINSNISNDISLSSVASYLHIHPNYLSRLLKHQLGTSYMEHVTKLKMEKAKKLLENSCCKIYGVAEALSYKDVSHFIKVFKKTYGVSPSEYRELL